MGTSLAWTSPAFAGSDSNSTNLDSNFTNFDFDTSDAADQSWIGALLPLGAATVAFPIGILMDRFGRKMAMLMTVVPFTIGWGLIIWPDGVGILVN